MKKDKNSSVIFENYSSVVKTNRDAWCYNLSKQSLEKNISSMVEFYNQQVRHFLARKEDEDNLKANDFIDLDSCERFILSTMNLITSSSLFLLLFFAFSSSVNSTKYLLNSGTIVIESNG